jgi:hypothetical protein
MMTHVEAEDSTYEEEVKAISEAYHALLVIAFKLAGAFDKDKTLYMELSKSDANGPSFFKASWGQYLNMIFEELPTIRNESAIGSTLQSPLEEGRKELREYFEHLSFFCCAPLHNENGSTAYTFAASTSNPCRLFYPRTGTIQSTAIHTFEGPICPPVRTTRAPL